MVKVTTNDPAPFYLRFGVADERQRRRLPNRAPAGRLGRRPACRPPTGPTRRASTPQRYHGRGRGHQDFDMPLAAGLRRAGRRPRARRRLVYDPTTQVVFAQRASSAGKRYYDSTTCGSSYTPAALRTAPAARRPTTRSGGSSRTVPSVPAGRPTWSTRLTEGKTTEYDQVRAIYDYFSREQRLRTTLTRPERHQRQRDRRLPRQQEGLLRAVRGGAWPGWCARPASRPGWRSASPAAAASANGVYTLTNLNLHAWTEVYFAGFGWVPFDATPGDVGRRLGPVGLGARTPTRRRRPSGQSRPAARPERRRPAPAPDGPEPPSGTATRARRPATGAPAPNPPTWVWWRRRRGAGRWPCCSLPALRRVRCAGGGGAPAPQRPARSARPATAAGPGVMRGGRRGRRPARRGGRPRGLGRAARHPGRLPASRSTRRRRRGPPPSGWSATGSRRTPRRPTAHGCSARPRSGPATRATPLTGDGLDAGAARGPPGPRGAGGPAVPGSRRRAAAAVGAAALATRDRRTRSLGRRPALSTVNPRVRRTRAGRCGLRRARPHPRG